MKHDGQRELRAGQNLNIHNVSSPCSRKVIPELPTPNQLVRLSLIVAASLLAAGKDFLQPSHAKPGNLTGHRQPQPGTGDLQLPDGDSSMSDTDLQLSDAESSLSADDCCLTAGESSLPYADLQLPDSDFLLKTASGS
jgi:hypothetical protein